MPKFILTTLKYVLALRNGKKIVISVNSNKIVIAEYYQTKITSLQFLGDILHY